MTNIKTVKSQAFGRTLHYVLDPVYAEALTSLTGKKTINDKDIANLETLGIAVNLKPETQLAFAGVQSMTYIYIKMPSTFNRRRKSQFVKRVKSRPVKVC